MPSKKASSAACDMSISGLEERLPGAQENVVFATLDDTELKQCNSVFGFEVIQNFKTFQEYISQLILHNFSMCKNNA